MIRCQSPDLTAPDGSIIAVIEENRRVFSAEGTPRLTQRDSIPTSGNFVLDGVLETIPRVQRAEVISSLIRQRTAGATIILLTHDEQVAAACADEVWWTRDGELVARGDSGDVLARYRRYCAEQLRARGEGRAHDLLPPMRSGDGRATLEKIETLGETGQAAVVFRSGEAVTVTVSVRFHAEMKRPVVGILLRTRIGLNVYGTNTELEGIATGPVRCGQAIEVRYSFNCNLCPGDYTITAACHDPDGVWHDWLEDALTFAVTDSRFTAGVANLKARVTLLNPA